MASRNTDVTINNATINTGTDMSNAIQVDRYSTIVINNATVTAYNVALASDEEYFVIEANEKYGSKGKAAAKKLIENASALFAGGDISEEDKANVMEALQEAYWEAKITNKKYTPKKYRKDQNSEEKSGE